MKIQTSLVLILLTLGSAAFGQTFYRSTMPDGRIVLGDRPTPGARKVEEVHVRPSPPNAPPPPVVSPPRPPISGGTPPTQEPASARDAAFEDLQRAQEALRAAEAARDAGQEPLEGERQGIAGGGSRLNESYFERQKVLANAIELARKRVDAAQAKVNSLR